MSVGGGKVVGRTAESTSPRENGNCICYYARMELIDCKESRFEIVVMHSVLSLIG